MVLRVYRATPPPKHAWGGYKKGVEKAGGTYLDAETQYADGVSDKAVTAMEAIIQSHPEGIAIVVCNNDDMAVGAARAAASYPAYKNTIFVGCGGNVAATRCNPCRSGDHDRCC